MAIQRVQQFISALKAVESNSEQVEAICKEELDYLRHSYNVADTKTDGIYNGLIVYMKSVSTYRRAIYDYQPNHIARRFFKASPLDTLHKSEQIQSAKLRSLKDVDSLIVDVDGYLETSLMLCKGNSYVDNILGIAALTGRRVSEVAYYSTFETCDSDKFDAIYGPYGFVECDGLKISNLAKKEWYDRKDLRISNNEESLNHAIIPVLHDSENIVDFVERLRTKRQFDSYEQFHNAASKELSLRTKKHYTRYLGRCTSHDLRKAYCRIIFDYYADMPEKAVLDVYSLILAQSSPANYTKFSCE